MRGCGDAGIEERGLVLRSTIPIPIPDPRSPYPRSPYPRSLPPRRRAHEREGVEAVSPKQQSLEESGGPDRSNDADEDSGQRTP